MSKLNLACCARAASGHATVTPPRSANFCTENDPYEEHDFGAFDVDGHTIFFKIDYYDPTLTYGSNDPADPTVTHR